MRIFNVGGEWSVLQMSPSNEDASFAQWYGLGTLNPRTCQVVHVLDIYNFLSNGNRLSPELAKPRCFLCCMVTSHVYFWIFATRKGRVRSNLVGNHWCCWIQFVDYRHSTPDCTVLSCQVQWCCFCTWNAFQLDNSISNFEQVCVCVVNTFWNTRVCKIGQYRLIKTNIDMKLDMKLNKA